MFSTIVFFPECECGAKGSCCLGRGLLAELRGSNRPLAVLIGIATTHDVFEVANCISCGRRGTAVSRLDVLSTLALPHR